MTIYENIRKLRTEKNITLEKLGNAIGTSKQTIQRYENGEIKAIPYDKILALADALGVTPSYLMGWESDLDAIKEAELDAKISNDRELKPRIEKYYSLPKEKQLLILNLIDSL